MYQALREMKERYGIVAHMYNLKSGTYCAVTMPDGERFALKVYESDPQDLTEKQVAQQEKQFVRTLDKILAR